MLLNSLLAAIVRADGDALVMHVGDRPYVVTSGGHVDLSTSGLALDAMEGLLSQLLAEEQQRALMEFGAAEQRVRPPEGFQDAFKIVAARGGDDIWIEITRQRYREPAPVVAASPPAVAEASAVTPQERQDHVHEMREAPKDEVTEVNELPQVPEVPQEAKAEEVAKEPQVPAASEAVVEEEELYQLMAPVQQKAVPESPERIQESAAEANNTASASVTGEFQASHIETSPQPPEIASREGGPAAPDTAAPAVIVPLTRTVRMEAPPRISERPIGIQRLLSFATARGASTLYLTSQSRPFVRVEGEIRAVDGESALTGADVETAVLELMPESAREAHGRGQPAEWVSEFDGIGRIRCTTFLDYRGPGAIFHLVSARPMSAEQLGLSREIQALATESEGLVVVASPRGGGKSTLLAALVDLINRNDGDYIISFERQIRIVHDNRQALVSQREVRGTAADAVDVARAALRENPDVLVIEDLNSPEVIQLALDAAGSGRLVFLSITAGSTGNALTRIVDVFPPERRKSVQAVLAERLCGVVGQVLVRKVGGGRLAARELLLSTDAVSSLIAEGQLSQLPVAIDSGRKLGMTSLNDALHGYLRNGLIEVREAYRKAYDRTGLLALLKRDGKDAPLADRFG